MLFKAVLIAALGASLAQVSDYHPGHKPEDHIRDSRQDHWPLEPSYYYRPAKIPSRAVGYDQRQDHRPIRPVGYENRQDHWFEPHNYKSAYIPARPSGSSNRQNKWPLELSNFDKLDHFPIRPVGYIYYPEIQDGIPFRYSNYQNPEDSSAYQSEARNGPYESYDQSEGRNSAHAYSMSYTDRPGY